MAKYFLINTVSVNVNGTLQKFLPGHLIDDASVDSTLVSAAGGELWPFADAIVAAAAAAATAKHLQRAISEAEMESIMRSAAELSNKNSALVVASTVFVYRQGGVALGNVFTTFKAAYDTAAANGGYCTIVIDDSIGGAGSCVTGACGLIDLTNIDLASARNKGTATLLTFETGTTVVAFRQIRNRLYLTSTSTATICTITSPTHPQMTFREQSGVKAPSTATSFFRASAGASFPAFMLWDGSAFINNGGAGHNVLTTDIGVSAAVNMASGATIIQNFAIAGAGTTYVISYEVAATIPASFPDVSGTATVFLLAVAAGMSFTDAAPVMVPSPGVSGYPTVAEVIASLKQVKSFTYHPLGTASPGVYITWATFVAAVAACKGRRIACIDSTDAVLDAWGQKLALIPAGAYDLDPNNTGGVILVGSTPGESRTYCKVSGATTIHGVVGWQDISLLNMSTSDVHTLADARLLLKNFVLYHDVAAAGAAFCKVTGMVVNGVEIDMEGASGIVTLNGGTNAIQVSASGTCYINGRDISQIFANQIVLTAGGTLQIRGSHDFICGAQAGALAIVPTRTATRGSVVIDGVTGKSAFVSAHITATARFKVTLRTPANDANTVKFAVTDVQVGQAGGTPAGQFKISALAAAGGGALNAADTSTYDWECVSS